MIRLRRKFRSFGDNTMNLTSLTILLLLGVTSLFAGSQPKYVYFTGTVLKVEKSKGGASRPFLTVKTDKQGKITFTADKMIKNEKGKYVLDQEFLKKVLALKQGQRIKIKRIPRECDCICFIDFKLLKKKE